MESKHTFKFVLTLLKMAFAGKPKQTMGKCSKTDQPGQSISIFFLNHIFCYICPNCSMYSIQFKTLFPFLPAFVWSGHAETSPLAACIWSSWCSWRDLNRSWFRFLVSFKELTDLTSDARHSLSSLGGLSVVEENEVAESLAIWP